MPRGLILIDAPPSPEDGHAWRASLLGLNASIERILITLDAHPDRTLGVRMMDCTVIGHEKVLPAIRARPASFKPQGDETGAEWETIAGLGNIRWAIPEISFANQLTLHWGEIPVEIEYHPGPNIGASWVKVPDAKVMFIGDAVMHDQPPFLADADIPAWLETLKLLLTSPYRDYVIIGSRTGKVTPAMIKAQADFLKQVFSKLEKLAKKHSAPDAIDGLVQTLLTNIKYPAGQQGRYSQRLRHGLRHYYLRHFHTSRTKA